jgi:hypothetical protein
MGKTEAGTVERSHQDLLEKPLVLRVEPIRAAGRVHADPECPADLEAADLEAPDLIEPLVAFRAWRMIDGRLRSPYLPVFWDEPVLAARCRRNVLAPGLSLTATRHSPPRVGCGCGIHAYHEPDRNFPTVDYRGVTGIVTLWGRIVAQPERLLSEFARIEALGFYSRWSNRQQAAVRTIADKLGVDLVDLDELAAVAKRYGERLHASPHQPLLLPA